MVLSLASFIIAVVVVAVVLPSLALGGSDANCYWWMRPGEIG